jgi:superfamily I DNA/RNA helicase
MSWLIPRNELTPDQIRAIELSPAENRAILGGPGSGKTQILLHRARYLADQFRVGPDRFRIFVYTNVLKDYIKSALSLLNLPDDAVLTFDHWCRLFYQQHVNSRMPWDAAKKQPDFDAVRRAVLDKISSGQITLPLYDFALVDEGQDLPDEVFTILSRVARHVTVCIDNKQQIYDNGSTEEAILSKLGLKKRNLNLIEAFRVCPYLVEVAAPLIPDSAEREAFRQQKRTVQTERQTPLLYFARNFEEEKQMLYQMVRERQLMNDRIAILFPQNRQVFGFAQGLTEAGMEVEVPKQRSGSNALPTHDFNSSRAKLMAFHSAKGLTFDSVLMPRLVSSSFQRVTPDRLERLVFVALTRAAKWAYFSTTLDDSLPLFQKLLPLEQTRQLTVRRGEQAGTSKPGPATAPPTPDNKLDFL